MNFLNHIADLPGPFWIAMIGVIGWAAFLFHRKSNNLTTVDSPSSSMAKSAVAATGFFSAYYLMNGIGEFATLAPQIVPLAFLFTAVAITLSIVYDYCFKPTNPDDVLETLVDKLRSKDDVMAKLVASLEENNALTRIQNKDFNDRMIKLDTTLNEFKDEMAEQVFAEVKKVITVLEEKLTKTLGESFTHLSKSVDSMVQWQDKYKEHIEKQEGRLLTYIEQLGHAVKGLEAIEKSVGEFVKKADAVAHVTEAVHKQHPALLQSMSEMAALLETMNGVPLEIKTKLESVVSDLEASSGAINSFQNQIAQQANAAIEHNTNSLARFQTANNQAITDALRKFESNATEAHRLSLESAQKLLNGIGEDQMKINSHILNQVKAAAGVAATARDDVRDMRNELGERK